MFVYGLVLKKVHNFVKVSRSFVITMSDDGEDICDLLARYV